MEPHFNLMYAADFYKISHKPLYPKDVECIHSTLVARGAKYNDQISTQYFYWFGTKLFTTKLEDFALWFFSLSVSELSGVLAEYKKFLDTRLNRNNDITHWVELYALRHIPLVIHAKEERTIQEFQTPLLTVENTHPDFFWLTSFVETTLLANLWGVTTAANRAWHIRQCIEHHMQDHTEEERQAIDFMGHDFSYRGLLGDEAATLAGCGHLAIFKGSDTIPAARAMEKVYGEITGFSVPATEHSVMCAGGEENELDTFNRILDVYPTGIVSIVSDTWDYYSVLKDLLPQLKDRILSRDGKLVIRPDSGDPVKVICGSDDGEYESSLDIVAEVFGYTLDSQGLKVLNEKIGFIYGDGMTNERIDKMLGTMMSKGYSPLNIVFGIGAFTYQFMTRDELGMAFKATAVKRQGKEWENIQKNPKTDPGKKSLTGRFVSKDLKEVYNGTK